LQVLPAAQHTPLPQSTGDAAGQPPLQLLPSALHVVPAGQHVLLHETENPAGQQICGFTVLQVSPPGQQMPPPQSTGKPVGQEVPQLLPSALHAPPAGQQVFWQDTGSPAGQHSWALSVLHVFPAGQQTPVPQSTGKPGGHCARPAVATPRSTMTTRAPLRGIPSQHEAVFDMRGGIARRRHGAAHRAGGYARP
jgi:hypothetical protein